MRTLLLLLQDSGWRSLRGVRVLLWPDSTLSRWPRMQRSPQLVPVTPLLCVVDHSDSCMEIYVRSTGLP